MRTSYLVLALVCVLRPDSVLGQDVVSERSIGFYAGADITQIDEWKHRRIGVTYPVPLVGVLEFYPQVDLVIGNERFWQALMNVRVRLPVGRDDHIRGWWYVGTGLAVWSGGSRPALFSGIQILPSLGMQPFAELRVYERNSTAPFEDGGGLELIGGMTIRLR